MGKFLSLCALLAVMAGTALTARAEGSDCCKTDGAKCCTPKSACCKK